MDKPLSLVLREFKENLVNVINNSGIHISIAEPIVRSLYEEVTKLSEQAYEQEKALYEKSLQDHQAEEESAEE